MSQKIITRLQAVEEGLTYYFTGKSCRNGHVAKRMTVNGSCYECMLAAGKSYRKKKRGEIRAKNRPK